MNTQELIAKRAYEMWENAGRPTGRDVEHWLKAEAEAAAKAAAVVDSKAQSARKSTLTTPTAPKLPKSRRLVTR